MFISMFKVAIPGDIKRMMFSQAGGMPREDDEFLVVGEIKREESHGQKPEARREAPRPTPEMAKRARKGRRRVLCWARKTRKHRRVERPGIRILGTRVTRREKEISLRCGRDGHKMYKCYANRTVDGKDLPGGKKVSAAIKRKRDDDGEEKQLRRKQHKPAAVKVGDEEMREAPPLWEADSEMSDF